MDSVMTPVTAAIGLQSHAHFKSQVLLSFAIMDIILWASLIALQLPLTFCLQGTWCAISYLVTGILGCVTFKIPSLQSKTATTLFASISVVYSLVLAALVVRDAEVKCLPEDTDKLGCSTIAQLLISLIAILVNFVIVYASCYRNSRTQPLWSAHHASKLYPTLKSNILLATSITNLVIMGAFLIMQMGSILAYGQGFWCGAVHLLTGISGCLASKKPTRSMLTTCVILTVISMLSSIAATVISMVCFNYPPFFRVLQVAVSTSSLVDNILASIVASVAVCSPVSPIQALWTPAAMETRPFPPAEGTILLRSMASSSTTYCSE